MRVNKNNNFLYFIFVFRYFQQNRKPQELPDNRQIPNQTLTNEETHFVCLKFSSTKKNEVRHKRRYHVKRRCRRFEGDVAGDDKNHATSKTSKFKDVVQVSISNTLLDTAIPKS